jgi:hypothetical protein
MLPVCMLSAMGMLQVRIWSAFHPIKSPFDRRILKSDPQPNFALEKVHFPYFWPPWVRNPWVQVVFVKDPEVDVSSNVVGIRMKPFKNVQCHPNDTNNCSFLVLKGDTSSIIVSCNDNLMIPNVWVLRDSEFNNQSWKNWTYRDLSSRNDETSALPLMTHNIVS